MLLISLATSHFKLITERFVFGWFWALFQGNPPLKSYFISRPQIYPGKRQISWLSNIRWIHHMTFVIFSVQRDKSIIMYIAIHTLPVFYTLSEFMHSKYIAHIMHYAHSVRAIECAHGIKYISAPTDGLFIFYILP